MGIATWRCLKNTEEAVPLVQRLLTELTVSPLVCRYSRGAPSQYSTQTRHIGRTARPPTREKQCCPAAFEAERK